MEIKQKLQVDDEVVFTQPRRSSGEPAGKILGFQGWFAIVELVTPDRDGNKAALYHVSVLEKVNVTPTQG